MLKKLKTLLSFGNEWNYLSSNSAIDLDQLLWNVSYSSDLALSNSLSFCSWFLSLENSSEVGASEGWGLLVWKSWSTYQISKFGCLIHCFDNLHLLYYCLFRQILSYWGLTSGYWFQLCWNQGSNLAHSCLASSWSNVGRPAAGASFCDKGWRLSVFASVMELSHSFQIMA